MALLVPNAEGGSTPTTTTGRRPTLHLLDALGSTRRLWIRGRLSGTSFASVELQTLVSGQELKTQVSVSEHGWFEEQLEVALPPARRGWRIARHQLQAGNESLRACNVVLGSAALSQTAVVVLLPLALTLQEQAGQRLTHLAWAQRLGTILKHLYRESATPRTFYYLAATPATAQPAQPELALAMTTLGWPPGHVVPIPTDAEHAVANLTVGLDRLRWLLAGEMDLLVINREPTFDVLATPQEDRAEVKRVLNAPDNFTELGEPPPHSEPLVRPMRGIGVPRHPIVFCHGMLAMSMLRMQVPEDTNYFVHLAEFLRERGVRALYPNVTPTGGVVQRAEELREQILKWTEEPVNIIAHSFGGLDARHMITHLGMADHVASLTTISTPHRGSPAADWFCTQYQRRLPVLVTLEAMGLNVEGFRDCQTAACRLFNERTPDSPRVRYFSYGGAVGSAHVAPMLRRGWQLISSTEGPNDGMVSVQSARWGEYLGTINVDHYAQTPDGLWLHPAETFDSVAFFAQLVQNLARRGL